MAKISYHQAATLVGIVANIKKADDLTPELSRALDDVRMAISPWYDI